MVLNMIIIVLLYVVIVRLYEIRASVHTSVEATQKAYDTSQLTLTSVAYLEKIKGRFHINQKGVVMNNKLSYGRCFTIFNYN